MSPILRPDFGIQVLRQLVLNLSLVWIASACVEEVWSIKFAEEGHEIRDWCYLRDHIFYASILSLFKQGAHKAKLRKIRPELDSSTVKTRADFLNLARTGTAGVVSGTHAESLYMDIVCEPLFSRAGRGTVMVPQTACGHVWWLYIGNTSNHVRVL